MTTKPTRPSDASTTATDRRPIAATLTIPDFSWQAAPVTAPLSHCGGLHATGFDAIHDSTPATTASVAVAECREVLAATAVAPQRIQPSRIPFRLPAVQRLQRWRRYWFPVGGGIAIVLLWLSSVLLDSPPRGTEPAVEPHRQARRESSAPVKPAGTSRLRSQAISPIEAPATTASTSSAIPATTEESAELPSTQPSTDGGTDGGTNGAANTAPSTLVTAPAASDPELAPPLNPPTGPRVAREVQSMPVAGPATSPRINPAQRTTTDTTALGAPQTAAPGPLPPTSAEPNANSTADDGAAKTSPPGEAVAGPKAESEPNLSAMDPRMPGGNQEVLYQQTDPTTYKDPVYDVPPLARQPKRSARQ